MKTAAAEARSQRSRAAAYTRRAEREAKAAADAYDTAKHWRRQAAQLTQTPRMWHGDYNPAALEAAGATWEHVGDTWLRGSFHCTAMAAEYRALAATWAAQGR